MGVTRQRLLTDRNATSHDDYHGWSIIETRNGSDEALTQNAWGAQNKRYLRPEYIFSGVDRIFAASGQTNHIFR